MIKDKLTLRISLMILLALLILPSGSNLAENEVICDYCKQVIKGGSYITVDGKAYHNNHFLCSHCGQPINGNKYYIVDGKPYDSACYVSSFVDKCDYCGKPIMGEYYIKEGKKYHSQCMKDHVAYRCLVCDKPLMDVRYSDGMGGYVCEEHLETVDKCHSCQRWVVEGKTEGLGKFNDGRFACAKCLATAVVDLGQAERLIASVRRELAQMGIEIIAPIELELTDVIQLRRQGVGFATDPLGVTLYRKESMMGGLITFKDFRILVLSGLPEAHLKAVLAHELMHVWLFDNAGDDHEPLLCEGSCEYAAYLVMLNDKSESGQFYLNHLLANDDPIYGQGLRMVMELANGLGIDGWLEYLKVNRTGPWQASTDY